MGQPLESWILDWRTIVALAPQGLYLLPGLPQLLGYLPQRFRPYAGKVSSSQVAYLSRIEKTVSADVAAVLRKIDDVLVTSAKPLRLGEIKDFAGLASRSQTRGQPIWEIDKGTAEQRDQARTAFDELADAIVKRTR